MAEPASAARDFLLIGGARAELLAAPPQRLPDEGFVWLDVPTGADRGWADDVRRLTGIALFDEHLSDSENASHPSFYDATERYEMIIFRALAFKPDLLDHDPDQPIVIATRPAVFFVLPRCLVTIRAADSRLFASLRERLLSAAQFNQRLPQQPEELMFRLLSAMVDRYLELRKPLTEKLDAWQRQLLNPRRAFRNWAPLLEAKMEIRKLQNLSEEQLDAIQEWRDERIEHADPAAGTHSLPPISSMLAVRSTDLTEHIQRVLNHARSLESAVESAIQLHYAATSYRTAEIMRVLTVLTAVFMPLTLITGIFGMNFEFLPGIHSRAGFWITLGTMVLIALLLIAFFSAKRYLETSSGQRAIGRPRDSASTQEP